MKRTAAAVLAAAVLTCGAAPALAQADPLQALQELIRMEQTQVQGTGSGDTVDDLTASLLPTAAEVSLAIDLEPGDTHEERAAAYIRRLEARAVGSQDPAAIAELGLAYEIQGSYDKALVRLEQAAGLVPGAQPLYDALAQAFSHQAPGTRVYVQGERINFDVQPVVIGGRTLVPIRYVVEQMGGQVSWTQATQTVTVTLGDTRVEVALNAAEGRVNGQAVKLDVPATLIGGRTLVPLRFVSESLNRQVDYHPGLAGTAVISIVAK